MASFHFQRQAWGPWTLNVRDWTLSHKDALDYEIDLEELRSSALMLDTIFQVTQKPWCSEEDAGHFLEALRALLDPQATLCSWGVDKQFNPTLHLTSKRP